MDIGYMRERLFDVRNWSRLPRRYAGDDEAMFLNKRNILFSQITLAGGVIGIVHAIESLLEQNFPLPFLDFLMTAVLFVSYYINELGKHLNAKILLLSFLNLFFFLYSLITPRDIGIYLFYFPWVTVAALIFDNKERFWKLFFISLSVGFLLVIFMSDLSLTTSMRFVDTETTRPFVFNIVVSLLLTTVSIYFMIKLNEASEERLIKLTNEVREKNNKLQKANEQLDRFIYSASHDIKLPIIAIKGLANIGLIDAKEQKSHLYFSKINTQTDKLSNFLLEMLEYSRNEKTNVYREKVKVSKLVDEVIENLLHIENAARIEFKKFIRIEENIMIDRVRFMVILNNLISNAIKYHNYSNPNPWVKIMISKNEERIQVMIADNGHGINDAQRDKVFEMFDRSSNSVIGSGLGLFIVKETVEKLNGRIMLSSTEGEGACFRIDLPLVA